MALANREPLSSSSSSIDGVERGRQPFPKGEPIPFPAPTTDDDDDEKLAWARDLGDLRCRLMGALGLHPVDVEEALRFNDPVTVEGAALKTLYLSNRGVVRRSLSGFFFTTLRRGLQWTPAQVRAYLETEAARERCDDCPGVGICPSCGRGEAGKWRK